MPTYLRDRINEAYLATLKSKRMLCGASLFSESVCIRCIAAPCSIITLRKAENTYSNRLEARALRKVCATSGDRLRGF